MASSDVESLPDRNAPPGLPLLPYDARDHKKGIAFWWTIVVLDYGVVPIALFYAFWYDTNLRHAIIFAIITSVFGLVTMVEYAIRSWKLLVVKAPIYRPIGGKRLYFDFTHIIFSSGFTVVIVELIVGTCPQEPWIGILAMPLPTLLFAFGGAILFVDVSYMAGFRAPFRISSIARGAPLKPGVYPIIEDVMAVDSDGKLAFREALLARWDASPHFRKMLLRISLFWSIWSLIIGAVITIVIFTIPKHVAYGVAFALPFVWAGIWVMITIPWVQNSLRKEKNEWRLSKSLTPRTTPPDTELEAEAATSNEMNENVETKESVEGTSIEDT